MLTPVGRQVAVGTLALAGLAVPLRYPGSLAIAAAGLFALAAGALTLLGRAQVAAWVRVEPAELHRGGTVHIVVEPTRKPLQDALLPVGDARHPFTGDLVVPVHQRGTVAIGPLETVDGDPFGLYERRRAVGTGTTVRVRPRIVPVDVSWCRGSATGSRSGRRRSHDGSLMVGLREYVIGDDPRRIHWLASARSDLAVLLVREHAEVEVATVTVVLDTRPDAFRTGAAFEDAVDLATSILLAAVDAGLPTNLSTTSGLRLTGAATGADRLRLLDTLTDVAPGAPERTPARGRASAGPVTLITGHGPVGDALVAAGLTGRRPLVVRFGAELAPASLEEAAAGWPVAAGSIR
ncbi:hypothetical protein Ais01nite_58900 [Asanoa ishikariensis]|uniref:Uncharacterized conserved protein, DUF58 family, contains vWF domain n=1 Tax=Asanoa ishikariensis TaxID=137265 RepID=A0A1H3PF31_9ACTN|nr:DUF58 domain-containing protein [Asanoa ishikariensis]GIF67855.1 hypothetical protein Ais01nite_58900 [Asanoa ishikariensis]SDY99690.1 Uncharacterized conserved protein, DUF58 family, contains vWF domain [Asanoa ishikariensis]